LAFSLPWVDATQQRYRPQRHRPSRHAGARRAGRTPASPKNRRAILVRLTPAGDRLAGGLLTEQRAAVAELLAELPEADQRHLLQPWSRYGRAGTTPGLSPARHEHGQERAGPRRVLQPPPSWPWPSAQLAV